MSQDALWHAPEGHGLTPHGSLKSPQGVNNAPVMRAGGRLLDSSSFLFSRPSQSLVSFLLQTSLQLSSQSLLFSFLLVSPKQSVSLLSVFWLSFLHFFSFLLFTFQGAAPSLARQLSYNTILSKKCQPLFANFFRKNRNFFYCFHRRFVGIV